jgi:hypothetical protein
VKLIKLSEYASINANAIAHVYQDPFNNTALHFIGGGEPLVINHDRSNVISAEELMEAIEAC